MSLTRKSHNCAGTVFVQGDSAGGSKLTEQTLTAAVTAKLRLRERIEVRPTENSSTRLYKNGNISVVITCS